MVGHNLSFENPVTSHCKKTSQKLHALERKTHDISLNKCRNQMKGFINSQRNYCPVVKMF